MSDSHRILVVDDETSIRITTVLILTRAGYSADAASDGREAMEKVAEFKPHLVLLDINMPGQNGIDVCRRIKSDPAHRDVTIVMMTVVADKRTVILSSQAGAAGYIVKPFEAARLLEKLRTHLDPPADVPVTEKRKVRRGSGLALRRAASTERE